MDIGSNKDALPAGVIALVPMRNVVLFPHVLVPITVGRPKSVAAVQFARQHGGSLGVVLQRDARTDEPALAELCEVGTLAKIFQYSSSSDEMHHAVCQGVQRFRIKELLPDYPFLAARVELVSEDIQSTPRAEALGLQLRERAIEILQLLPAVPAELAHVLQATRDGAQLADIVASLLDGELAEKQALLETLEPEERLNKVLLMLTRRIEVLRLSQEIGDRTKEQLDDRQRKFLLREQLKTIQHELGEDDAVDENVQKLEGLIAKAGMPEDVEVQARKELARLKRMSDASSEYSMQFTYLEWLTELPWVAPAATEIDLKAARAVLEADHHGLERIKQRIVEFLAVQKLNPGGRAPILCFVGPPGVGKTSLGQSIARALGRPFVRVSLGGVHDEAEIRGHRRTYIGSMPGNILQGLRKAGARNCVMMLDEVDKLTASSHGDPSAALLEVLDPEQNATFRDNYLGQPFDLSRVVFIATANVIDQVPPAVRDRMEVIELPGYTQEEKIQIARRYLLPRQRERNGLSAQQCEFSDAALRALVADYTREAGVRQLEREIARAMRHAAMQVAGGEQTMVQIEAADLDTILGPIQFEHEVGLRTSSPGVATGLAWTPVGGDILFVEAMRVPGSGKLILTGQLGEVMKESAQAALTLVKSRAASMEIAVSAFDTVDIHVHVPAGAIPKDGPSAGVAMFIALASLFTNRVVRHEVAMTGEISLRGMVLPVGGVKDKVLAAQRAGLAVVMLPARNEKDLREVPESSRQALQFVWLKDVDDAIRAALG
ncbi:endopeptidase La [Roseateles oligotrophus]|uniref:Lon protease n=1 Tax=Roseateles oligotrophus TaxID=1769250 RepID=A0ABT2YMP0_9BURK|nr:endopeptidase La [Roseateles oligotrophus]MCV2371323.1 endopeptidase La [Roseateles oligotrophus]